MLHTLYFTPFVFQLVPQTGPTENPLREAEEDKRLRLGDGDVRDHHHGHRERALLRRGVQQGGRDVHRPQDANIHLHCGASRPYCGLPYARNSGIYTWDGDFPNGNVGGQEGIIKFKSRFNSWFWHQSLCKFSQIVWFAEMDVGSRAVGWEQYSILCGEDNIEYGD